MMNIDKYLDEISVIDSKITNKQYEIEELKETAKRMAGAGDGERVQSSSEQDKMASIVAKYTDKEREVEELQREKQKFIDRIEVLPKRYYELLHDVYIKGYTLKQSASIRGKKYTWVTSNHSRAKRELAKVIRGEGDV